MNTGAIKGQKIRASLKESIAIKNFNRSYDRRKRGRINLKWVRRIGYWDDKSADWGHMLFFPEIDYGWKARRKMGKKFQKSLMTF